MPVEIKIGRKSAQDIIILDKLAEDAHAVIEVDEQGTVWIKDLQTKYGTLINNKRISTSQLKPGDHLQIGFTTIDWEKYVPQPTRNQKPTLPDIGQQPVGSKPEENSKPNKTIPSYSPAELRSPKYDSGKKNLLNSFGLLILILCVMWLAGWLLASFIH
jgi:pSer/pThr/pTyr-binding forkhead associated (FHA) protein